MSEPKKVMGLYALGNPWIAALMFLGLAMAAVCFVFGVSGHLNVSIAEKGLVAGMLFSFVVGAIYTLKVTPIDSTKSK